jgi:hypothetical protein
MKTQAAVLPPSPIRWRQRIGVGLAPQVEFTSLDGGDPTKA